MLDHHFSWLSHRPGDYKSFRTSVQFVSSACICAGRVPVLGFYFVMLGYSQKGGKSLSISKTNFIHEFYIIMSQYNTFAILVLFKLPDSVTGLNRVEDTHRSVLS